MKKVPQVVVVVTNIIYADITARNVFHPSFSQIFNNLSKSPSSYSFLLQYTEVLVV